MAKEPDVKKVRILLIEDNPADVDLLRRALKAAELDWTVTLLQDGAEALAFFRRIAAEPRERVADLILLDLNLPKNDGVEVLQAVRACPVLAGVPVAVMSSSSFSRERARIEQFGIRRYIKKPADLDEFLRIGAILKELLRENARAAAQTDPRT